MVGPADPRCPSTTPALFSAHTTTAGQTLPPGTVQHAIPLVLTAELPLLAASNTKGRLLGATGVAAPLADDIHHSVLLVLRAELPRLAGGNTKFRRFGAGSVGTLLVDDIYHPVPLVLIAELPFVAAGNTKNRLLGAASGMVLAWHPLLAKPLA